MATACKILKKNSLQVAWRDGHQSVFGSSWLRSACREDKFFNSQTLLPTKLHTDFRGTPSKLRNASVNPSGDLRIEWEDDSAEYNWCYLRAHDMKKDELANAMETVMPRRHWKSDGIKDLPQFDLGELKNKSQQVSWMREFFQFGAMLVHGVDTAVTDEALVDVFNTIGPIKQRYHPTRCWQGEWPGRESEQAHEMAYDSDLLRMHSDTPYYEVPARLVGFTVPVYECPTSDILTLVCDSHCVAKDFKERDPSGFQALTKTKVLFGRRRYTVEEECSEEDRRMFEWDAAMYREPICLDEFGRVERVHLNRNHLFNVELADQEQLEEFERAYAAYGDMCDSDEYKATLVLKPGSALICDNWRLHHARAPIPEDAHRILFGGFMTDETVRSRWRLELTKESQLEDKWFVGCTDPVVHAIAALKMREGKERLRKKI